MKKGINKLTLLFFFIIAGFLYGQSSGKISGTVTDESTGEPVIGANIIIEGTYIGAATDVNGEYVIVNVPPGTYTVTTSYIGYAKTQIKNVKVMVDLTTHLNIKMSSTTITMGNEVVVVAQAPLVIKDMTSTESRVSAEEINSLPIQDLNQLVTLQAGVSKDANGGLHIRGGRSSEISYLVNGVSITDDYNRTQALTVDPESVQELQVISGTFNAEYGNAMSGVVNVVTKTGGSKFQGNLELWTGDYVSSHQDIFMHIKDFSPIANYNFQGSVSGPILTDKLTYFFTGRRYFDGGYIYGRNIYNPEGRVKFVNGQLVPNPGDSSYVSMNSSARWSGQGTIDWRISKGFRFKLDAFGSTSKDQYYDHLFQLDPHGAKGGISNGYSFFSTLTHFLGASTYQQLTAAYKYNNYKSWLYDNPFDPRYVSPDSSNVQGFHFATAGNDLNRFQRSTKSYILKWDIASQVDNVNFIKLGVNSQYDKLFYEDINLVPALDPSGQQIVPFVPDILGTDSPQHDRFNRHPFNFSAYAQDKIEFESVIINIGLRFDLFNPYGKIPIDQTDPNVYNPFKLEHIYHDLNNDEKISLDEQTDANKYTLAEREAFWYKNTAVKTGLSPRFGVAYPITDKGIIRFSFGIFQQIPDYSQLYLNDQFKLTSTQGVQGPFGNNDLNPQRTTIYELGLQQQLTQDLAIDLTAY
ncbi:MAG: carboxypeptidase-like regulatory domain-containing protein, partial [Ignavibacteriaceae bacterium]